MKGYPICKGFPLLISQESHISRGGLGCTRQGLPYRETSEGEKRLTYIHSFRESDRVPKSNTGRLHGTVGP